MQVAEKQRFNKKEFQDRMYEERAAKLAELEYRRNIDVTKDRNKALLEELRSKRPY